MMSYSASFKISDYTIDLVGESQYTGQVNLTYIGVEGRICTDGWTNTSATVLCHELGYPNGTSYTHYKSEVDSIGM